MKKLLYLLLLLPLGLASCNDDDDTPNVDVYATYEGGTQVEDAYYVVKGTNFDVTAITLVNNGDKEATIGGVRYFWDYMPIGTTVIAPYDISISTDNIPVGNHLLTAEMPIYAVGYSICTGYMAKKVVIVEEEEDIPSTATTIDSKTQADIQTGNSSDK